MISNLSCNKIYTINQKGKSLSCHGTMGQSFVIGFRDVRMARKIQYNLAPNVEPFLLRSHIEDITDEVNCSLRQMQANTISGKVVIDVKAQLHIQKLDDTLPPQLNDGMFHLETLDYSDFMMFPFEKNLGIIMPYEVLVETEHHFTLLSNVIENSDSSETFRKSLDMLMHK